MATIKPTTVPTKRLAASITAASSAIQLNNILGWDGVALTSSDFGTKLYCVLRNDANTLMEIMELDPSTIASASITVLRRGLKFTGDQSTEVSANKLTWIKNETLVELGTDVPQLLASYVDIFADQSIAGVKTFSDFPVKSGSTSPTSADQLATKAYVDLVVGGSAAYDQQLFSGTAGETLAAGNLVYLKESDQRWWLTDADAFATINHNVKLGIAQGAATAGNSVTVLLSGTEKNLTGLTAGSKYYVSGTAGAVSTTPGARTRFVGWATSTTRLIFAPDAIEQDFVLDTAGETLVVGDFVYFKTSDQKWWKTDADALATAIGVEVGVCQLAASADGITVIRTGGVDRTVSGLTPGSAYYLSNTGGAITASAPTLPRVVGYALSAGELLLAKHDPFAVDVFGQKIYAADSVGTDAYAITLSPAPVGYFTGMVVRFKAGTANTGACTINVNGLGAKTIKKSVSTDTATGDILQNQIVEVIYDGTNFQILSPIATTAITVVKGGQTTKVASDASTTQNIAHGLGAIPKFVKITAFKEVSSSPGGILQAMTVYDGTTQSSASVYFTGAFGISAAATFTLNGDLTNGTQTGVVTFDATNIIITWTKTNSPGGTYYLIWEAYT